MAVCPECGATVKAAVGKLVVCPKCETRFRAADEPSRRPAAKKAPAIKKAASEPALDDDETYGFSEAEDLVEVRKKREEQEAKRAEEKKKVEKPVIEVKRKNIGDLAIWERIDKSMVWFLWGVAPWGLGHFLFGLILFLGIMQGPEYAGPVVSRLIRPDQPPLELGAGDALDRPGFVIAMLGGLNLSTATLILLLLVQLCGWVRTGLWVTGYSVAWPSAPRDSGGRGQLIALYSLAGANFVFSFFLVVLPFLGAYSYMNVPWSGSELAMAEYNMERSLPLHVFWAFAPFWETTIGFVLLAMANAEPILIAYFTWTVACEIREEPLEKVALGAVKMGFAVLFLLFAYRLFALAGTSPVLVQVLRILYALGYAAVIAWMIRLAGMTLKCRETFRFYFFPDQD